MKDTHYIFNVQETFDYCYTLHKRRERLTEALDNRPHLKDIGELGYIDDSGMAPRLQPTALMLNRLLTRWDAKTRDELISMGIIHAATAQQENEEIQRQLQLKWKTNSEKKINEKSKNNNIRRHDDRERCLVYGYIRKQQHILFADAVNLQQIATVILLQCGGYMIGDRVRLKRNIIGTVRYIGDDDCPTGEQIGIECDTYDAYEGGDGSPYFTTEYGYGIFVTTKDIIEKYPFIERKCLSYLEEIWHVGHVLLRKFSSRKVIMLRKIVHYHSSRRYIRARPDFNLQPQSCLLKLNTGINPDSSGTNHVEEILDCTNNTKEYFVGRVPLIGLCEDKNSSYMRGSSTAPLMIRQAFLSTSGSFDQYYCKDHKFINTETLLMDCGNLECNNDPDANHNNISKVMQTIFQINVESSASAGYSPQPLIVLGGDHSITFPILLGCKQSLNAKKGNKIAVIHFDAHPDLYPPHVMEDKNIYSHASPFYNLLESDTIASVLQIGIRAMTQAQEPTFNKYKNKIKQLHVEQLFGFQVDEYYQLMNDQMNLWMRKCHLNGITNFYISIDLDVLEPCNAAGVSHYEPCGLSNKELFIGLDIIMSQLYSNSKNTLIGCDIVELNPETDYNYMTAIVAAKLMKRVAANFIYFSTA